MPAIINTIPSPPPSQDTPSKGILRKQTNKRPASLSTAGDPLLADMESMAQAKRRKVSFVPKPSIRVVEDDDPSGKSAALIREEVRIAIEQRNTGADSEQYNDILAVLEAQPNDEDAPPDSLLSKYLQALAHHASALKQPCSGLVHAVLHMQWLDRNDTLVSRYDRFLVHVCTTNTGYVSSVLRMLIDNFAHLTTSAEEASTVSAANRTRFFDQLHDSVSHIIDAVPSALGILSSVVAASFPYIADGLRAHIDYVGNLLRLTYAFPELKAYVLDLIMDRVAKLDVQVQTDINNDELGDNYMDDLLNATDSKGDGLAGYLQDDDEDINEDDSDSEDEADSDYMRAKRLRMAVLKLDSMLDLLFQYCDPVFKGDDYKLQDTIFSILLAQLRNNLIKQSQSRHAQFLVFHFAQQSDKLQRHFIDTCFQIVTDKNRSEPYDKVSAAAYLSSFVCRASHISHENIIHAFETLASYINDQRKFLEPNCSGPDVRRFAPFYAAVQALMYMFCFRWRNLLDYEEDVSDMSDMELLDDGEYPWPLYLEETFSLNFNSRLNPLKVCAPHVVEQFAQMALQLRFMFIHNILEANKRVRLGNKLSSTTFHSRQTASAMLRAQEHHQLAGYFPFDPYTLPKSKRWVANDYNEWRAPSNVFNDEQQLMIDRSDDEASDIDGSHDGGQIKAGANQDSGSDGESDDGDNLGGIHSDEEDEAISDDDFEE